MLYKKENASWNLFPENDIELRAETRQAKKAEREKGWEGKTMKVFEDGITKEVPYSEGMQIFEGFFNEYFDLYISFDSSFFIGDVGSFENYKICFQLTLRFETLEQFINELKAEYELFTVQFISDGQWN